MQRMIWRHFSRLIEYDGHHLSVNTSKALTAFYTSKDSAVVNRNRRGKRETYRKGEEPRNPNPLTSLHTSKNPFQLASSVNMGASLEPSPQLLDCQQLKALLGSSSPAKICSRNNPC
jgi:hypothetical protein